MARQFKTVDMASAQFLIAGSVLYVWRRLKGDPAPTKIEWRSVAMVGW
ncbi:MAG: hypothetical protein JXA33_21490 [Anaerolineae bacterium]|nr:hypothetical protein [Anaerolineae bacterium]